MTDPILITVLITSICGVLTEFVQIYLDYKRHEKKNEDYLSPIVSSCCTYTNSHDHDSNNNNDKSNIKS